MAGLLVARVLTDAYEQVTLVERDALPASPETRDGVLHGKHAHVLLEAGRATVSDSFPGYGKDLIDAGALTIDVGDELRHYDQDGLLASPATRMKIYCASRPLLETVVRQRLAELDGVTIRDDTQFTTYQFDADSGRVHGVRVRADEGLETLDADIVVNATGRTSRTPVWLGENGYSEPSVEEVEINMLYTTIRVDRPEGDQRMPFIAQSAPRTRGGAAFPVDSDEWVVILDGMHGTDPHLSEVFYRVVRMEAAPTDLFRPSTIRRTVTS